MAVAEPVGAPVDSSETWADLTTWLPAMLTQLLASEVFHVECRPPRGHRGVYLFSEAGQHLYVGRTGSRLARVLKEERRSRAFGTGSISTPSRGGLRAHRHSQTASCASVPRSSTSWCLLIGGPIARRPLRTSTTCTEPRRRASALWSAVVVSFADDIKGVRSTVAEVYAHVHLSTRYNDFSTS
jgi:hypothetical protein